MPARSRSSRKAQFGPVKGDIVELRNEVNHLWNAIKDDGGIGLVNYEYYEDQIALIKRIISRMSK